MEKNDGLEIMFSGFIREDDNGYSCVLQIAGIPTREAALKIGLEMSGPVERALAKTFGKFKRFDTLSRGHA